MGRISIEPFQHEHLNPSSVDLTLGPTVVEYILKGELDARKPPKFRKYGIENSGIVLKPGRAYLMHTNEIVHTDHYVSVLDGKSSLGRLFISVHETAGYVDPGFKGQITLEVTVTHPVRVYAGMRFCQLRFYSMVGKPVLYGDTGHYLGELAMGAVPSLCHQQIKESGI
jgi:dCTP deaminase